MTGFAQHSSILVVATVAIIYTSIVNIPYYICSFCCNIEGLKYTFLFALGSERTLVMCKSCEARSASQRLTRDLCPFISQCKKVFFNPYIYDNTTKTPLRSKEINVIFWSHDRYLSLENIYPGFLSFIAGEWHRSVNNLIYNKWIF